MTTTPDNVDSYIESLPEERQLAISTLRKNLFEIVPDAEECIEYKMPLYKLAGETICAFASQKNYISLYIDPDVVEQHVDKLKSFNVGKGCIRFKKIDDMPTETFKALIDGVVKSK